MKRNTWKLLIDVVMIVFFLLMYKKRIVSIGFHEIIGLLVFVIVLIHLFFNRKLFIASAKKFRKIKTKTKLRYIVDVVLLIDFVLMVITGIMISKVLFNFGYFGIWKFIHNFLCAFALILVGIHLGLEWDTFYSMIRKIIKLPKNPSKSLVIVISLLILVGGAFSMANTSFADWLSGPFTYDPSNPHGDGHGNGLGLGKGNGGDGQHLNGTDMGNKTGKHLNGTGQGKHDGSGQGKHDGTGPGNGKHDGSGQGKHDGSGKGLHKNQNRTGEGLGNNGTLQHKNQNVSKNNSHELTYDSIFNSGNIDYVAMIINIIEIGFVIGFFGVITRFVTKRIK